MTNKFISSSGSTCQGIASYLPSVCLRTAFVFWPSRHSFLPILLLCLTLFVGIGNAWGTAGDALKTMASSSFSSGYGRKTPSGHIGFGQTNYLGANNGTNHGNYKPTAADLPVVKAVNASASTSSTGLYYWYSTTSNTNVGSIEFSYTAVSKGNSTTAVAYIVYSSTAASDGSATWEKVTLSNSSTSVQGANVASAGTYTFTFSATQTSARYYGIVIQTSGYVRMTNAQLVIKEGATSQCTNPATALSVSSSASATVGTPMTLTTANGNGGPVTWEITSGSDNATLDGSTLTPTAEGSVTVKATQDDYTTGGKTYCGGNASKTITITKASATISLEDAGAGSTPSGTFYGGDSYQLPTTATTCTGKDLVGWSKVEILTEGEKPTSNYYAKGTSVTLAAGTNTFYAVYATAGGSSTSEATKEYSGENTADVQFSTGSSSSTNSLVNNTGYTAGKVNVKFAVLSGTNYTYYDGTVVRFYANNSITVTPLDGATITSVEIVRLSTTSSNSGVISVSGLTASEDNTTTNTNVFTGTATSAVTFTNSGQCRFTAINITYSYSTTTYTNYATSCCSPLGPIKGSFFWTHFWGHLGNISSC